MSIDIYSLLPPEASELYDCLRKKLDLLREFSAATESLKRELDLQNLSKVNDLLDKRQSLIEIIDRIDEQIGRARLQVFVRGQKLSEGFQDDILVISKEIEEILQEVKCLDQECMTRMASWQDEIKNGLLRIKKGFKTVHCYSGNQVPPPKFMDATG